MSSQQDLAAATRVSLVWDPSQTSYSITTSTSAAPTLATSAPSVGLVLALMAIYACAILLVWPLQLWREAEVGRRVRAYLNGAPTLSVLSAPRV